MKVSDGGKEPVIPYHEKVGLYLRDPVHGQNPLHAKAHHADALGFTVEIGHVGHGGEPIRYFIPWSNITGIRYGEG